MIVQQYQLSVQRSWHGYRLFQSPGAPQRGRRAQTSLHQLLLVLVLRSLCHTFVCMQAPWPRIPGGHDL